MDAPSKRFATAPSKHSSDDDDEECVGFASPHACFEYVHHLVNNCTSSADQETLILALVRQYIRAGNYGDDSVGDLVHLIRKGKLALSSAELSELLSSRVDRNLSVPVLLHHEQ